MAVSAANPATMSKVRGGGAAPRSFGEVLRDLLIEAGYTTSIGNPDWMGFTKQTGMNYESLRKAIVREREPSMKIMESVAAALGVEPTIFWEYQLAQAQQSFDPKQVGEEAAYANLQAWLKKSR